MPYSSARKFLFATKTITENYNHSKCRVVEPLKKYTKQLLYPRLWECYRKEHRKIVKTRALGSLLGNCFSCQC